VDKQQIRALLKIKPEQRILTMLKMQAMVVNIWRERLRRRYPDLSNLELCRLMFDRLQNNEKYHVIQNEATMPKQQKRWVYSPKKAAKPKASDTVKTMVQTKANELVENVLKPQHIQPPPEEPRFNYLVDIYTQWYRNYFYFCGKYHSPGPNAISPYFEIKFARLEYAGQDSYHLAYRRHTGQWWELYQKLSLDECLAAVRDEPHFLP
jgi:hypothetical protein